MFSRGCIRCQKAVFFIYVGSTFGTLISRNGKLFLAQLLV